MSWCKGKFISRNILELITAHHLRFIILDRLYPHNLTDVEIAFLYSVKVNTC
jgi:hypothetical protein